MCWGLLELSGWRASREELISLVVVPSLPTENHGNDHTLSMLYIKMGMRSRNETFKCHCSRLHKIRIVIVTYLWRFTGGSSSKFEIWWAALRCHLRWWTELRSNFDLRRNPGFWVASPFQLHGIITELFLLFSSAGTFCALPSLSVCTRCPTLSQFLFLFLEIPYGNYVPTSLTFTIDKSTFGRCFWSPLICRYPSN